MKCQTRTAKGDPGWLIEAESLDAARRRCPPTWTVELVTPQPASSRLVASGRPVARGALPAAVKLREDAARDDEVQLQGSFRRLGLSESSAMVAAAGRAGRRGDFPRPTVESSPATGSPLEVAFGRLGLAADRAKIAASGRG